jgi:DNA-directed RNA polymerase beta' subunit
LDRNLFNQNQDKSDHDAAKRRSDLARVTNAWIELQEAVNCLMDSSKNTNAATAKTAPTGIRQELERKEVRHPCVIVWLPRELFVEFIGNVK